MKISFPRILHAGESCLVVEFGSAIDLGVNARVQALRKRVEASHFPGFVEAVPTYRSLAVCFDPLRAPDPDQLERLLLEMSEAPLEAGSSGGGRVLVSVCYEENKANGCAAISEIDVHTIESLSAVIVAPTVITGEVTGEMRTALRRSQNRNIRFSSPGFELRRAGFLAVQAWKLFRKGAYESGDGLTPIYLHTNGPAIRAGA